MANLLVEFQDIGYKEYDSTRDIPFTLDAESMNISWVDTTVMPVKPKPEMLTDLNSKLVVKRIWAPTGEDINDSIKRVILREARYLHHAKHRHVVRFETAFFNSENRPYMGIVMDRADDDIGSYLEAKRNSSEMARICGWFRCLANAVAYVHGLGITHRDIKPPNILVKDGKVLLADFGISKLGLVKTLPTTEPNMPRGRTPQYAAPEVDEGGTRGRSADIFSLGAVFLEMLVAHSCPTERCNLNKAKTLEGHYSYGKRLEEVREWINDLENGKSLGRWQKMVLCLCREMMSQDRDERPDIEKVYQTVSSTPLPNNSPAICCIHLGDDDDLTNGKRLIGACRNGNESEVKSLLERRVDPNTIGAIHQASAHGFGNILQALLRHGTDVNLQNRCNQTALHCAAGYGHEVVAQVLLGSHAKVNLRDDEGRTPLLYASGLGHSGIVGKLLTNGADITVQDQNGQTALHFAAKGRVQHHSNYEQVIRMLLSHRADANARDIRGRTPSEYAERKRYDERVRLLGKNAPGAVLIPDSSLTEPSIITVESLSRIIQPPRQYSENDIKEVSNQLKRLNADWEKLTKTYMILNIIMQPTYDVPGLLNKFVEKNFTDFRLPVRREELAEILDNPGASARFLREQSKVLSDKLQFRKHGEHHNIREDEWRGSLEEMAVLGQGDSGKVYKVRSRDTGRVYALKQIGRNKRRAGEELKMLQRVKHDNVVSLAGSFTSPNFIGFLMHPAAEYNLAKYLDEAVVDINKRLSLLGYFGCLANALSYLHNKEYVRHNDIKPQNILVHDGRVFLTDFGISLDWSETLRTTTWAPAARTPLYCAPEVTREGQAKNSMADIWSLGCVFLEMMTVLKGRYVNEIGSFFNERHARGHPYNENLPAVLQWIKILEREDTGIGDEPLEWIQTMLREDPNVRPSAWTLRQTMLDYKRDSVSKRSFFGNCCSEATSNTRELNDPRPPEETSDEIPIEEHTCIAAIGWPSEQRLYFQGTDGGIRQATRRQRDSIWEGGRTQDKIATAKLCSPIAATSWQQTSGHRQPTIRVYFLNEDNYIQERAWNPISGWGDGRLNVYHIKAASSSELAVTSWGDGNIILCYQDDDCTIRILHGWARTSEWQRGSALPHAAPSSPLAAVNFEHLGNRGLRLFCKLKDSHLRELCWDKVEDKGREDSDYYVGGYQRQATPEASISAIAFKQVDLEMFVYSSTAEGIRENRYSGGWLWWDSKVGNGAPARSISTVQLEPGSVRVYFVEGSRLGEVVREGGNWTQTFIMSGVACRGAECPRRTKSEEHQRPLDSTHSISAPDRQSSELEQVSQPKHPSEEENQQLPVSPMLATTHSTEYTEPKPQQRPVEHLETKLPTRSLFKRFMSFFCRCT